MLNRLKDLEDSVRAALPCLEKLADIEALQFKTLGRKGELNQIMRGLGALSPEERPGVGQEANRIKGELERLFEGAKISLDSGVKEEVFRVSIGACRVGGVFGAGGIPLPRPWTRSAASFPV